MKILETERLTLEELEEERFDELASLLANKEVHRYFPKTLNRQEAREFFDKIQNRQRTDGVSFWAVVRKEDMRFLGICGLLKQSIDGFDEIEVGYRIHNEFWGQGYGTEAARGCLEFVKSKLHLSTVISLILPANKQSIRVAEKNGLTLEKETMFHGQTHLVYRIHL